MGLTLEVHENGQGQATDGRHSVTRRQLLAGSAATGGLLVLAGCSTAASTTAAVPSKAGTKPRHGGNLRVALLGGSPADTLDAHEETDQMDNFRIMALYNGLVQFTPGGGIANVLAEEMVPNKNGTTWTIRLRPGVTFSNGKPFTAEDVVFTLRRIMDPKDPKVGASALLPLDPTGMRIRDSLTIELNMLRPYTTFISQIADQYNFGMVPVGYDPSKPIGTGPFKVKLFTPGVESIFVRNDNYFQSGRPYLDELTIFDYSDESSAENAILDGEIDAYAQAPLTLSRELAGNSSIRQVVSRPAQWVPFTMRVDQAPFTDVRVRQAFRLLCDRPQFVDVAFAGLAAVGNDVFCPNDPDSDHSLVRHQDLPQAKYLLKQAGQENLTVQLVTADFASGALQEAQVFKEQAAAAGIRVNISVVPVGTFYGPNYLKWTFAMDFWGNPPYLATMAQCEIPGAPFNECHFDNPRFASLYYEANATTDPALQREIVHEMQTIDFDEGGYIIPAFNEQLDLLSTRVQGVGTEVTGISMGNCDWENMWLS